MTIDRLRLHVLLTWIVGVVICYATLVIAVLAKHHTGVTLADVKLPASHLWSAVVPTLGAMIGAYFSGDRSNVFLTKGQQAIVLVLSYVYVGTLTFLTFAMLFVSGFKLDENATPATGTVPATPAVNNYSLLIYLQPLVVAGLFFLFGKGCEGSGKTATGASLNID